MTVKTGKKQIFLNSLTITHFQSSAKSPIFMQNTFRNPFKNGLLRHWSFVKLNEVDPLITDTLPNSFTALSYTMQNQDKAVIT